MQESPPRPAPSGLELRVERDRAVVRFAAEELEGGLTVRQLSLEIPRSATRVDVGGGPSQFRHLLCDLDGVEVELAPAALERLAGRVPFGDAGLSEVETVAHGGLVELSARLASGARFTCRLAAVPGDGEALQVVVLDPRVHALSRPTGARLAHRIAGCLAGAEQGGAGAASAAATIAPLRHVLLEVLSRHGFKLPRTAGARLATVRVGSEGVRLGWARFGAPPALPPDPVLAAALDGMRTFRREEAALAEGDEARALAAWLALPRAAREHPFAAARILSLAVASPDRRGDARALAAEWLGRDPAFAPALLAEALLATEAGELAAAARAFATLARVSAERGHELAVLAATDACASLGPEAHPDALGMALSAALDVRRSHLPALRALHDLARRTLDRASLLRACRGIVAYGQDASEKARAHARLAVLLAKTDRAAARVHLGHAQRLGPTEPETLDAAARLGSR